MPSAVNVTLAIRRVALVATSSRGRAARQSPRSGSSHWTVGWLTTFSFAGTKAVFGRIEVTSPAWSTFLSSWKSLARKIDWVFPSFSGGTDVGSGKTAYPEIGS